MACRRASAAIHGSRTPRRRRTRRSRPRSAARVEGEGGTEMACCLRGVAVAPPTHVRVLTRSTEDGTGGAKKNRDQRNVAPWTTPARSSAGGAQRGVTVGGGWGRMAPRRAAPSACAVLHARGPAVRPRRAHERTSAADVAAAPPPPGGPKTGRRTAAAGARAAPARVPRRTTPCPDALVRAGRALLYEFCACLWIRPIARARGAAADVSAPP